MQTLKLFFTKNALFPFCRRPRDQLAEEAVGRDGEGDGEDCGAGEQKHLIEVFKVVFHL